MTKKIDLFRGTLDMLVLRILNDSPLHGYAIAKRIQKTTEDVLNVEEGSLYPALYRMQKRGWIAPGWGTTQTGRRATIYRLTRTGRERLESEVSNWGHFSDAVGKILET